MKKAKKAVVALLPLMRFLVGCQKESGSASVNPSADTSTGRQTVYVTDFTLDKTEIELEVGGTDKITATLAPKNATKKGFDFSSSDAAVATVSSEGVVTAIGAGSCKIFVETKGTKEDGTTIKKEVNVTVTAPALSSLTISNTTITIKEQATAQISYEIKPANAVDKSVTYVSADSAIATVSNTGLITGVAAGETDITLTTNAKDANGEQLTGKVHVVVESLTVVHKVEFQNSDGSLIQAVDEIADGEVPQFTADAPKKATDAEGIYIFRGFDKEIVAYQAPADNSPVVYKAIYEKTDICPHTITLTKETDDETHEEKAVLTISGEAIGYTTDSIKETAYIALQQSGGSWGYTYSDRQSPIINADGSWSRQRDIDSTICPSGNIYRTKTGWNDSGKSAPIDNKLLHRAPELRYRHNANGEVLEDNRIPDNWDGVFPENYVSDGYIDDTHTSLLSAEDRQAYVDAIPNPTWVGLDVTYTPADFRIGDYNYKLFCDDTVFQIPSLSVTFKTSITKNNESITLVEKEGEIYYRIQGDAAEDAVAGEVSGFYFDFQEHGTLNRDNAWGTIFTRDNNGVGTITEDKKWYFDVPVSTNETFASVTAERTYVVHFGIPGEGKADPKVPIADTYTSLSKGNYSYSLLKNTDTWNIPCLVVTLNAPAEE